MLTIFLSILSIIVIRNESICHIMYGDICCMCTHLGTIMYMAHDDKMHTASRRHIYDICIILHISIFWLPAYSRGSRTQKKSTRALFSFHALNACHHGPYTHIIVVRHNIRPAQIVIIIIRTHNYIQRDKRIRVYKCVRHTYEICIIMWHKYIKYNVQCTPVYTERYPQKTNHAAHVILLLIVCSGI